MLKAKNNYCERVHAASFYPARCSINVFFASAAKSIFA